MVAPRLFDCSPVRLLRPPHPDNTTLGVQPWHRELFHVKHLDVLLHHCAIRI